MCMNTFNGFSFFYLQELEHHVLFILDSSLGKDLLNSITAHTSDEKNTL